MNRLALILLLALTGCTRTLTVAPAPVVVRVAAASGNSFNGGTVSADMNGFVVTPEYVSEYRALLAQYPDVFTPRPAPDQGITRAGSDWRMDAECYGRTKTLRRVKRAQTAALHLPT